MKWLQHLLLPPFRTHFRPLVMGALVLTLAACTEPEEGQEGYASEGIAQCTVEEGAAQSLGVFSRASAPKTYQSQPQVLVLEEPQAPGLQKLSVFASSSHIAVYDKACALSSEEMAFPEVRAELLRQPLSVVALEVEVGSRDAADLQQDLCLKSLTPNKIATTLGVRAQGFSPDDSFFKSQTHHDFLDSEEAWKVFYGLGGIYPEAGKEVVVAVVDTGVNLNHEDLGRQLWTDAGGHHGINFYGSLGQGPTDVSDDHGHGTHVAGLIAAEIENGKGGAGVAPVQVKIMAVKALGGPNGSGSVRNVVNGINWAVEQGADVINLSLGISGSAPEVKMAVENAVARGVFVVAAAGNQDLDISQFHVAPASHAAGLEGFMSVGSLDVNTGAKSSFSNHSHSLVEIFAPGAHGVEPGLGEVGLLSTVGVRSFHSFKDYESFSGTSMAAPLVAGAAALVIAYYQSWGRSWSPALIETHLKEGSPQNCDLWEHGQSGRFLNLKALADRAKGHLSGR